MTDTDDLLRRIEDLRTRAEKLESDARNLGPPVEDRGTWESYLEGPRWAFNAGTIRRAAIDYGLEVEYIHEDKGWFTKTVSFKISGPRRMMTIFRNAMVEAVQAWNGR